MTKEMIISSTPHETRVAIIEDDQVVEIFIEREHSRGVVGNVYKGRVSKVLPGMQSSFIDIGLERDGFLYVAEVIDAVDEFEKLASDDEEDNKSRRERENAPPKIEDLLRPGQEILVQVVKEPLGTKGARLTSHVTLPGRFLVFMPTVDHIGVSRKIEAREERSRLRGIVREFREQHGFTGGVIIRTAAAARSMLLKPAERSATTRTPPVARPVSASASRVSWTKAQTTSDPSASGAVSTDSRGSKKTRSCPWAAFAAVR